MLKIPKKYSLKYVTFTATDASFIDKLAVDFKDKKLYNGHQKWVPSLPTKIITTYVLFAKFQQIIFDVVWLTFRHIANLIDIILVVVYTVFKKRLTVIKLGTLRSPCILKNEWKRQPVPKS